MKISIIVAASTNNVIGQHGQLPWRLPDDLKRFKRLTTGKPVIMGRRTFESIGKPLPERQNIVLSTRPGLEIDGCEVAVSTDNALELSGDAEEVMVIGGGKIYEQMLPMADRIYMTRVNAEVEGDAYFPGIDESEWRITDREDFAESDSRQFGFSFITMDRVNSAA
ncbi:MAG: type 3 dihydrofolate reductase [Woeseia sp.]